MILLVSDDQLGTSTKKLSKIERIKQRTQELYDSLPQEKEARKSRIDVRDEVIELNYTFFGYVASKTYVNNYSVTYEDKFQSALMHFCECWWWYKWKGDETHRGYRDDLSFTVFFKPRVSEMISRELSEVKYSVYRTLCMEAGEQLGKHWAKVTYDDLKNVRLPANKMNSLKAMFGSLYIADLSEHETYMPSRLLYDSPFENPDVCYDSIEELLIHDMIETEGRLDEKELKKMSTMYDIDINILKSKLPVAEKMLYDRLHNQLDISSSYM